MVRIILFSAVSFFFCPGTAAAQTGPQVAELAAEYQQLDSQYQTLQAAVKTKQDKNEAMRRSLDDRRADISQQNRMQELSRTIKIKEARPAVLQRQLRELRRQEAQLDREINEQKLKMSSLELRQSSHNAQDNLKQAVTPSGTDKRLADLRSQLQEQGVREAGLERELEALRQQKQQSPQALAPEEGGKAKWDRVDQLKKIRADLEAKISAAEDQMAQLKDSSALGSSWGDQKKKLIHEMVQADARNDQMRRQINTLREDIEMLRSQVAKLERRAGL